MRRWAAAWLATIVLGACTAPSAVPASASPSASSASTATAPTPALSIAPTATTLVRTPEPVPTGSPQSSPPPVATVSQVFALGAAAPLIEVVGPYRTAAETDLRSWIPSYLQILDGFRKDPSASNRGNFDLMFAPGPYAELIRQSLQASIGAQPSPGPQRKLELGELTIQHMYAKPWGRVAYIDAVLTFLDRMTDSGGKTSSVQHVQQARFVNQGHGMYKVIDGYDAMIGRWVDGEQPRWSSLALEAEAAFPVGWYLQRESYVPAEQYPHAGPPGSYWVITAYDKARNDFLNQLDASYAKKEFTARRFDDVSVRISRFEPATFLGDGVVTLVLTARLVTAAPGGPERSTPVTRTLRFYRITRDGLNANWQAVDEQGSSGAWLSGGNLELAEIDQDRG